MANNNVITVDILTSVLEKYKELIDVTAGKETLDFTVTYEDGSKKIYKLIAAEVTDVPAE